MVLILATVEMCSFFVVSFLVPQSDFSDFPSLSSTTENDEEVVVASVVVVVVGQVLYLVQ